MAGPMPTRNPNRGRPAPGARACLRGALAALSCTLALTGPAAAQSYPVKPVHLILPSPPGGGTDVVARTLAQKLSESLGQPVIVENKPGGSGTVGAALVAKSAPDGYTLMISASVHLINALILKQVPYDAVADFTPITQIAEVPLVVVVHPATPLREIRDLAAKNAGGDWNWAVAAIGSPDHLVAESMRSLLGLSLNIVPYRGMGPAIADTLGGQVAGMASPVLPVIAHIRDGRLRPLAVTTASRNTALPGVPTLAESGLPGFSMTSWYGLWGPRGLPPAIAAQLAAAARAGFQEGDVKVRFPPESFQVICSTPEAFARLIDAETARYGRIVREAKISADRL
jgi:tripartite-type tricarboxylate transporter receptor subunit TctC